MPNRIQFRRGTLAGLNSVAIANGLLAGEPFFLTDLQRFGAAVSSSSYRIFNADGEGLNGPIGATTPNTGAFTKFSGSQELLNAVIANNTTLDASHIGRVVQVNGGTINLPADADWGIGDEITMIVVGTNPTTINGNGAFINLGPFGAFAGTSIAGRIGQWATFKKVAANLVFSEFAYSYLAGLLDTVFSNTKAGDSIINNGTNWVNIPAIGGIDERKRRATISPGSGTAITTIGIALTNVGTVSNPARAIGSVYSEANKWALASAATAGALASSRCGNLRLWRGNAAGKGGFRLVIPFGLSALIAGMRSFVGISNATSNATNVDPLTSTASSKIGVAINANTGNWNLIHNLAGAVPTVIALGANFPVNITSWFELELECAPNAAGIKYTVRNLTTGLSQSGEVTANLPGNLTFMNFYAWACNNATATAVSIQSGMVQMEWD